MSDPTHPDRFTLAPIEAFGVVTIPLDANGRRVGLLVLTEDEWRGPLGNAVRALQSNAPARLTLLTGKAA